jgi:succinate dehydrogenase / fumarate reductase cytochrome b subunit
MTTKQRPLSPHLQVYRLPLTGLISITHRITGVLLSLGLLLFLVLLLAIAGGESAYQTLQTALNHGLINLLLWGFIASLFFHLCHGIRHLLWDRGLTLAKADLQRFALYELAAAVLLTVLTFVVFTY